MYRDSTEDEKKVSSEKQQELYKKFSQYVHRKDASLLRSMLPPLRDTLVTIKSSGTQDVLMRKYFRHCEEKGDQNFFRYGRQRIFVVVADFRIFGVSTTSFLFLITDDITRSILFSTTPAVSSVEKEKEVRD
jgi:hypothetical protein